MNSAWAKKGFASVMLFAGAFGAFASRALAVTVISPYIPGSASSVGSSSSPGAYLVNLYDLAFLLGGLLAFGAIVYGGVRYAASAGNPSGLHEATEWIRSALLGLLLLAAAYLVLFTVNPALVNLSLSLPSLPNQAITTAGGGNCIAPSVSCGSTCCPQGQGCSTNNTCVSLNNPQSNGSSCPVPLCGGICCASGQCGVNVVTGAMQCQ